MILKDILKDSKIIEFKGDLNINITNISSDSRLIEENGLFFAITGYVLKGTDFIESAIKNGATAVVVEPDVDLNSLDYPDISFVKLNNLRKNLAFCSCNLYDNPSKKLKLVGVTGTKGKTTSTYMIKSILEKHGYKVGLIGSIETLIGNKQIKINDRTTGESYEIQKMLSLMVEKKVDIVIIEVSSQAMKLDRVIGCDFDITLFTNLSEDHISPKEHPTMEDYFQAKLSLLKMSPTCVVNLDNEYTKRVPKLLPDKKIITFGINEKSDVMAKDFKYTNSSVSFTLILDEFEKEIEVSIPGKYMGYNAIGAIAVSRYFDVSFNNMKEALKNISVFGRSEMVPNKLGYKIMIDYAHTPSSLESILQTVKPYTKGRVICAWGVGGDRDNKKRPIMGEISGRLADFTILTCDQPRTEDPSKIAAEIEVGLKKTNGKYKIIINRTEAIRYAIHMMNKDDILVLPGLGNDLYIEYMGVKYPYNERVVINDIIDEMANEKQAD